MTSLKQWAENQWQAPGVLNAGHGNAFIGDASSPIVRAGTNRTVPLDKETKRRRAGLAMYSERLRPLILAEATKTGDVYRWPKIETQAPAIPRKRVSHKKVTQAAAILAKVPQDELTAFLARFGLSLSLAASIASLDNVEQIARQFLRATL